MPFGNPSAFALPATLELEDLTRPRTGGALKLTDASTRLSTGIGGTGQPNEMDLCAFRFVVCRRGGGLLGRGEATCRIGCGEVFAAAELALRSMRVGEAARFRCTPPYAYLPPESGGLSVFLLRPDGGGGDEGAARALPGPALDPAYALPSMLFGAHLDFELELLRLEPQGTPHELSCAGRCARAAKLRSVGNALFKAGYHEAARVKYERALNCVAYPPAERAADAWNEAERRVVATEVELPALLNLAACFLRARQRVGAGLLLRRGEDGEDVLPPDPARVITLCTRALAIDPGSTKALFRRAQARRQRSELSDAKRDLAAALRVCPRDRGVRMEWDALKAEAEAAAAGLPA